MVVQVQNPNYIALSQGVKLYTDAMRRFAQERLIAAFGDKWWEIGVLQALSEPQRANVKRDMEDHPGKKRIDYLDAQHLERVVTKTFSKAFATAFGDFDQTQVWLKQASLARSGGAAHSASGDLPADETGNSLWAMAQVLTRAGLPEAADVEGLRRAVLGMGSEASQPGSAGPQPTAPTPVAPAPTGTAPYWWQVCEPHDAFKNPAQIDESAFAATLGGVAAGAAREEYKDRAFFFTDTATTENLKQTVYDVASRLSGGEGPSVTELQTPFGGGKTHALLTLYHLIKQPQASLAVPGVREALGNVSIPQGARVLVFDGQERGPEPTEKADGA